MTSQEQLDQKIKEIAERYYPVKLNPDYDTNLYYRKNFIYHLTSALQDKELLSLAIKVQEEKEKNPVRLQPTGCIIK